MRSGGDIGGLIQLLADHPHPEPRRLLYDAVEVTGESFNIRRFDVVVPEILEGILQYLLVCGADVNFTDRDGLSVLYWATMYRLTGVVEWLLNHGAIVHTSDVNGICPIHQAAWRAEIERLREEGAVLRPPSRGPPPPATHTRRGEGGPNTSELK